MLTLWSQGVTDSTVVVIKPRAYEGMVTYLRIKLAERDRMSEAKGRTCERNAIRCMDNYRQEARQNDAEEEIGSV